MIKKDITMKKNTFLKGAFISTFGIVLTKIMGIIYVIPFHSLIGEEGGALYGYAYTIYLFFLSISSAGIPLAISRLVSEYQTLGYYNAKKRVFVLGKRIALIMGTLCFLIIIITAPILAKAILGNVSGGNSIKDVTFVIRVVSFSILIIPILSIYRGYFEGHRFLSPPSISQVIEQLFRVLVIIFGSFFAIKVLKLNVTSAVGVALFGAFIGGLCSYMYLIDKLLKNKKRFNEKIRDINEPMVSDKTILKKIIYYAVPFVMIDVFKSLYNYIDMFSVVKGLVNYANYSATDAESIYSMLSTWATKFNMIVLSISSGVIISLIPNLTESVTKNDFFEVNKRITQALNVLLFLSIPITLGISFLSKAVWILFYGDSVYGSSLLSYYIFVGLISSLFTAMVTTLLTLKDYKSVFLCLVSGVLFKLLLTTKLLISFSKMSLPAYYGVITSTIIGYLVSFVLSIIILKKKYNINFGGTTKNFIDIMCASLIMFFVLFIVKCFVPIYSDGRLFNIVIIMFYGILGSGIYFAYSYVSGLFNVIFGNNFIKYLKKIFLKK